MRRLASILALLALLLAGGAYAAFLRFEAMIAAPGPLAAETLVTIPPGSGVTAIAATLRDAGAIDDATIFGLAARRTGHDRDLKAGQYRLPAHASMLALIELLHSGDVVRWNLTVPEGLTSAQIMALLEAAPQLQGEMPAPPAEGTLLPETWSYTAGDSRQDLLTRMADAQRQLVSELWAARAPDLPLQSAEEAVILASIVEKETSQPDEMPEVAAVFENRLKRGMMLQSDPTAIFVLTGGQGPLGRRLLLRDLEVDSPYNTYRNAGLPPGPICHPGRAALNAVLHPAPGNALYFVADGTGGHVFADSIDEHNRNVAAWRRIRRERDRQGE